MQKQKRTYVRISDVTKKLGITFEELASEFAECGISITNNDKVTPQTLKYVLSGMHNEEYTWGSHLHLETGEVAGEIHWQPMRGNEGDETHARYHDLSVQGWATRLGVDEAVLLNELHSHGWKGSKTDIVGYEDVKGVINGVELHTARDASYNTVTDVDHTHCLDNDCGTYAVSDMAGYLGVPAVALTTRLHYSGADTKRVDMASKDKIVASLDNGRLDRKKHDSAEHKVHTSSYCDIDAKGDSCAIGATTDAYRAASEETDIPSGVVAIGTPDKAIAGSKMHAGIAWGLLSFLAIPLLAGLFLDSKNNLGGPNDANTPVVAVDNVDDSIHTAAGNNVQQEKDTDKVEMRADDARREDLDDTITSIMEKPTTGAEKGSAPEGDVQQNNDAGGVIKNFIKNLGRDTDDASSTHGAALPTMLPKTGAGN